MNCPKCQVELETREYMDQEILVCPECEGTIIEQKNLEPLLLKLYAFLMQKIDFTGKVETIPDKQMRINCPSCAKQMDQHGYMGSKNVIIDICQDCKLLFMDKHELGVMALLIGQLKEYNKQLEFSNQAHSESLAVAVLNSWILY